MENILPRREARENAFLLAFSQTFGDIPLAEAIINHEENDEEHPVDGFSKHLLNAYYDHSAEVDDEIRAHLRNWTMERLPRVSLTVLRLAVYELEYEKEEVPVGVAINEAVELAKCFGSEESGAFVNGILGKIANPDKKVAARKASSKKEEQTSARPKSGFKVKDPSKKVVVVNRNVSSRAPENKNE